MKKLSFILVFLSIFSPIFAQLGDVQFYHFKGTLSNNQKISMDLEVTKNTASGVYYVSGGDEYAEINGKTNSDGQLVLNSYKYYDEYQGKFTGKIINNTFSGSFEDNKNHKSQFTLKNDCSQSVSGIRIFSYNKRVRLYSNRKKPNYHISLKYIYPTSLPNPQIQPTLIKELNEVYFQKQCDFPSICINSYVQSLIKGFREDCSDMDANDTTSFFCNYETTEEAKIVYNEKYLLTIELSDEEYSGGAHGMEATIFHSFDLKTGKEYTMYDVLQKSKQKEIIEKIKQQFIAQDMQDDISIDELPMPSKFAIINDGIKLIYGEYEIAAYAAGEPSVFLKFKDIKDLLTPEFRQRIGL